MSTLKERLAIMLLEATGPMQPLDNEDDSDGGYSLLLQAASAMSNGRINEYLPSETKVLGGDREKKPVNALAVRDHNNNGKQVVLLDSEEVTDQLLAKSSGVTSNRLVEAATQYAKAAIGSGIVSIPNKYMLEKNLAKTPNQYWTPMAREAFQIVSEKSRVAGLRSDKSFSLTAKAAARELLLKSTPHREAIEVGMPGRSESNLTASELKLAAHFAQKMLENVANYQSSSSLMREVTEQVANENLLMAADAYTEQLIQGEQSRIGLKLLRYLEDKNGHEQRVLIQVDPATLLASSVLSKGEGFWDSMLASLIPNETETRGITVMLSGEDILVLRGGSTTGIERFPLKSKIEWVQIPAQGFFSDTAFGRKLRHRLDFKEKNVEIGAIRIEDPYRQYQNAIIPIAVVFPDRNLSDRISKPVIGGGKALAGAMSAVTASMAAANEAAEDLKGIAKPDPKQEDSFREAEASVVDLLLQRGLRSNAVFKEAVRLYKSVDGRQAVVQEQIKQIEEMTLRELQEMEAGQKAIDLFEERRQVRERIAELECRIREAHGGFRKKLQKRYASELAGLFERHKVLGEEKRAIRPPVGAPSPTPIQWDDLTPAIREKLTKGQKKRKLFGFLG